MAEKDRSARFTLSSAVGLKIEKASSAPSKVERSSYGALPSNSLTVDDSGKVTISRRSQIIARAARIEENRKWHIVDATDLSIGRAAALIANVLRGKHKANFSPHVDCGDGVVVINAEKVRVTSRKLSDKVHYKYAGDAGVIKGVASEKAPGGRFPERMLEEAVGRMIPRGPLGRQQMRNLRIFAGAEHPPIPADVEILDAASMIRRSKARL